MRHRFSLLAVAACALALSTAAHADHRDGGQGSTGHWAGHDGWHNHPGWGGDIRHFDRHAWEGGHWWHGDYGGRLGWWWIIGPNWFWYPTPVYPYPDPFVPPTATPGYWYWCDFYRQYYPYVGSCPSGWRAVPATP